MNASSSKKNRSTPAADPETRPGGTSTGRTGKRKKPSSSKSRRATQRSVPEDMEDPGFDPDMDEHFPGEDQGRALSVPERLKSHSDRLVAAFAADLKGPEVLVVLLHGTTLAAVLRAARPDLNFTFFTPEHFLFRTLRQFHRHAIVLTTSDVSDRDIPEPVGSHPQDAAQNDMPQSGAGSATGVTTGVITIVCSADPPDRVFDEAIYPTHSGDNSEQAQEFFQTIHQRLKTDGRLYVSTNNPKDRWVQSQLRAIFSHVAVDKQKHGIACVATRVAPLKKVRGFRARSVFRLRDRLVTCESRPGVFSHRRIDGGARALIKALCSLKDAGITASGIIEMGCGCGAVSMAAALEYPEARILSVDSDARAIECTRRSAVLNEISRITTLHTSDGNVPNSGEWDLLLGNPPYYSDYRIAELFLQTAGKSLRPGGRVLIVTKLLEWHEARMKQLFKEVFAMQTGDYSVFIGVRK